MNIHSVENVEARQAINSIQLIDIMSDDLLTAYEGWSVKRLAGFFVKHNISGAPVVAADEELVGVVTLSDVVRFNSRERTDAEMENLVWMYSGLEKGKLSDNDLKHLKDRASETCTVNSIMTPKVISVDISTPVVDVCSMLVKQDIHHLFVTEKGKLIGVATAMDVLRAILTD